MNASKTVAKRRAERCMVALCRLASALRACTTCRLQTQDRKLQAVIIARVYITAAQPHPSSYYFVYATYTMRIRTLTALVLAGGRV